MYLVTQLTGITTGTFVGDGSGLTGVTATGSGVVIKDSGVLVGVAQSLNFDRNIDVTHYLVVMSQFLLLIL